MKEEDKMKKQLTNQKERQLKLGKTDIYHFPTTLDRDEQKQVRGGSVDTNTNGRTAVPIFC
jgi:hypothetical protein